MKKWFLLLLLAELLLTGCGVGQNAPDNATGKEEKATEKTESSADEGADGDSKDEADKGTEQEVYVLEFTGTTIDGKAMTSEVFAQSKLTMVNVWATYCPPCIKEMPDLGEIGRERDTAEFQIIGIIADVMESASKSELDTAKEIITDTQADYPHLLLGEELYYNLVSASSSVPTTYFFNQDGELLGYIVGAQSKENWESVIDELLAEMK